MREETRDTQSLVRGEDRIGQGERISVGPDGPVQELGDDRFSTVMTMASL